MTLPKKVRKNPERPRGVVFRLSPKEFERFSLARIRLDLGVSECARVAVLQLSDEILGKGAGA